MLTSIMRRLSHVLLLLPACIAPAVAAEEAIVRPQVGAGDAWTYRQTSLITQRANEFVYRVDAVSADRIKVSSDGYSETYTPDWNLLESSAGFKIKPHEGYFDFPLEPGKTYPFKAERSVAKTHMTWQGTVKVAGWETLQVPAGSFRVLRVDISGSRGSGPPARRAQLQLSYWWSPETPRWLRQDLWMSKPASKVTDLNMRTELIRYTPAQ